MRSFVTLVVVLVVLAGGGFIGYLFRTDPLGPLPGQALSGQLSPYPADWQFAVGLETVALETRPDQPHSVRVPCIVRNDRLLVLATDASVKRWPAYLAADARVRVKAAKRVFPAMAVRVADGERAALTAAFADKYATLVLAPNSDVQFFRLEPR